MSARAPAGSASRNIGSAPATCTRATASGLADSEVISQPAPTSCIQVPMLEAMLASHSQRKVRWRSGCQGEAVFGVRVAAVMAAVLRS